MLGERQAEPGCDGAADQPRLHARTPRTYQQDTRPTRGQLLPRYVATSPSNTFWCGSGPADPHQQDTRPTRRHLLPR